MTQRLRRLRNIIPVGMYADKPKESLFNVGYRRYSHTPAPLPTAHTHSSQMSVCQNYLSSLTQEQRATWSARYNNQ